MRFPMLDDRTPRNLPERTGRHVCIQCMAEVETDDYLRNDHLCDGCAERESARDEPKDEPGTMNDER